MTGALRPGDVAVDVGAYKGGYTYLMRRSVGPDGRILAFEPQPAPFRYLERAVRAFGWRNVEASDLALSDRAGAGTLRTPGEEPSQLASLTRPDGPGGAAHPVRTAALDEILGERARTAPTGAPMPAAARPLPRPVRLLKCDVEGHELEVLRGARSLLTTHRPLLLVECEARHQPHRSVTEVFRFLEDLGYEGFTFWGSERVPVPQFRVDRHQVPGRRPYANNFVFEPQGRVPIRSRLGRLHHRAEE